MTTESPICLYDGVCVLCSSGVRYTLRHERDHSIRFVALQSQEGRRLAARYGIDPDHPESFLFIEQGKALTKTDATLAVLAHLGGPARLLLAARILPRRVRDWIYDRVARNRYRLFGKSKTCTLPDAAQRHRFTLPDAPSEIARREGLEIGAGAGR